MAFRCRKTSNLSHASLVRFATTELLGSEKGYHGALQERTLENRHFQREIPLSFLWAKGMISSTNSKVRTMLYNVIHCTMAQERTDE